jgi:exonuclease SbcD
MALDFGEAGQQKMALVVEASAGTPARVTQVPLTAGRPLQVVKGTLAELQSFAAGDGVLDNAYLRVHVRERLRLGLADEVRELFPNVVDVVLEAPAGRGQAEPIEPRSERSAHSLFAEYLRDADIDDPNLVALFDTLYEEATA